ncbi:hypothetical protein DFA_02460 [Cavenderia fasciculata]|uniref:Uncharacterized protein n=1 Tax=Cavenderia fasciculata TaxID=261658 RepID=F4PZI3_CACFS|nr:uncharacterized protein DFA_02460 [Cavenderia fasciculata]EGG19212.1 hypothetical protein DFA_02460 [Cavenderia fasciculata]|eukprot:XP_004366845.1 hypothetical protein DFA_02460 [Cavenderia fasciculata]
MNSFAIQKEILQLVVDYKLGSRKWRLSLALVSSSHLLIVQSLLSEMVLGRNEINCRQAVDLYLDIERHLTNKYCPYKRISTLTTSFYTLRILYLSSLDIDQNNNNNNKNTTSGILEKIHTLNVIASQYDQTLKANQISSMGRMLTMKNINLTRLSIDTTKWSVPVLPVDMDSMIRNPTIQLTSLCISQSGYDTSMLMLLLQTNQNTLTTIKLNAAVPETSSRINSVSHVFLQQLKNTLSLAPFRANLKRLDITVGGTDYAITSDLYSLLGQFKALRRVRIGVVRLPPHLFPIGQHVNSLGQVSGGSAVPPLKDWIRVSPMSSHLFYTLFLTSCTSLTHITTPLFTQGSTYDQARVDLINLQSLIAFNRSLVKVHWMYDMTLMPNDFKLAINVPVLKCDESALIRLDAAKSNITTLIISTMAEEYQDYIEENSKLLNLVIRLHTRRSRRSSSPSTLPQYIGGSDNNNSDDLEFTPSAFLHSIQTNNQSIQCISSTHNLYNIYPSFNWPYRYHSNRFIYQKAL